MMEEVFSESLLRSVEKETAGPALAGADLQRLLDLILKESRMDMGTLHTFRPETNTLELAAKAGVPPPMLPHVASIPLGKGIAGQAAQRREPVSICNLQQEQRPGIPAGAKQAGTEGALCVPMLDGPVLKGTLGVSRTQAHDFSPVEIERLMKIGAAIARRL